MSWAGLAIGLAAAAGWVAAGAGPAPLSRLAGQRDRRRAGPSGPGAPRRAAPVRAPIAAAAVLLLAAAVADVLLPAAGIVAVLLLARRVTRKRRESHAAQQRRAAVIALCDGLAAELRAGRTPAEAMARAGPAGGEACAAAVRAAAAAGDVPAALRACAAAHGAEGCAQLAACWQVAEQHGAGLAQAAARLSRSLRAVEAHRREVAAQLAGPRATARMLAGLPAFGLLLGAAVGARPFALLAGSEWGRACLVAGLALDVLGLWWTDRLAAAAERA